MRLTPLRLAFLFGAALFLLGPTTGFTQPGGGKGGKGGGKGGGPGGGGFDPATFAKQAFDRYANGKDVIVIAELPTQGKRGDNPQETMRAWAEGHGITNGQITLDQYTQYMQDRFQQGGMGKGNKGGGGPGGPGGMRIQRDPNGGNQGSGPGIVTPPRDYTKDAEDNFRRHDKDNEGKLTPDNMPGWLKDEWQQWDKNGDGFLDLAEYKEAYKAHQEFMRGNADGTANQDPRNRNNRDNQQVDPVPEEDKRPTVYHVGNLPKELPPWFVQLDRDKDGQVGLYEWKRANPPMDINLFMEIDRNGDGFLTVEEVLRWQKVQIAAKKKGQGNTVALDDEDNPDGTPNEQPNTTIPNTTYPNMRGPGSRGPGGPPGGFTRPGSDPNGATRPGRGNNADNSNPGGRQGRGPGSGRQQSRQK